MQGITLLSMFLGCVSALPVYRAPLDMRGGNSGKNRRPNVKGGMGNGAGGTGWNGAVVPGGGDGTVFMTASSSSYNGQGYGGAGGGGNGAGGGKEGVGNTYISSSASDYDSTPSDGGGDTNPIAPTLPPGGDPTKQSNPAHPLQSQTGGFQAAGILLALGLVVGVCVGVGVYIIKKKG